MSKLELLDKYQHKACCHHSYRNAIKIWRELEPLLSRKERISITIAVAHHELGEGRAEFDDICLEIIKNNA